MALQKQQFSIDFVKGANTKTDEIVSKDFREMENVVFSGEMTAKKMPGYDLIASTPVNNDPSLFLKRKGDKVVQNSTGSYKFFENLNAFKKISDLGSGKLTEEEAPGEFFAAGASYNAYMKASSTNAFGTVGASDHINNTFTFTDKKGAVINSITLAGGQPYLATEDYFKKWTKIIAIGDDFYFSHANGGHFLQITQFKYNAPSNEFMLNDTYFFYSGVGNTEVDFVNSGANALTSFDMITDGTSLFVGFRLAESRKLYKFTGNLTAPVQASVAEEISTTLELYDFDATYFLMAAPVLNTSTKIATLMLRKYRKSDLGFVSEVAITSQSYDAGTTNAFIHFSCFPTSATTAVFCFTIIMPTAASDSTGGVHGYGFMKKGAMFTAGALKGSEGLIPLGKVFRKNGKYYVYAMLCLGESRTFLVVDIETLVPRAVFNRTAVKVQFGLISNGRLSNTAADSTPLFMFPGIYAIQEQFVENGVYTLASFDDYGIYKVGKFSFDSHQSNSIEIGAKNFISGPVPMYFDGVNLVEHDLIGEPFLVYTGSTTGGALPADTSYQVVACYVWRDSSGVTFRSGLSNVLGSPKAISLSANSKILYDIYLPLVTAREGVECHVYAINSQEGVFQLVEKFPVSIQPVTTKLSKVVASLPFSSQGAEVLYTQLVGPSAVQLENLPAMSMRHAALFSDRIFYIKDGDENTIYFSQKKVQTEDFAFNENFLLVRAYDKRGFNEDKLVGLQAMDGRLFIFKENSILYTAGDGPGLDGSNSDLIPPQLVTTDVGCISSRSIVLMPAGIMFMSDKGIYLLDRKLQASYIGSPVERFNDEVITSSVLLESKNEIRFTTMSGHVLVFNYYSQQWSWFKDVVGVSALITDGVYSILTDAGEWIKENPAHHKLKGAAIVQKLASPWLRLPDTVQAWAKVYELLIVGKYKTPHQIKLSLYFDYEEYASDVYTLDPLDSSQYNITIKPSNGSIEDGSLTDGVYQFKVDLPRKNCQAFRFEIEDIPLSVGTNTGECFALSNFTVTYGIKKGPAKLGAGKDY